MKLLLLYILVFTSLFYKISCENKPVIIIHGMAGVQTEAKLNRKYSPHVYCPRVRDWYLTWLTIIDDVLEVDCFVDNFKMIFDESTESMINQEGVQLRPLAPWGSVEGISYLNPSFRLLSAYFDRVIDTLTEKFGYMDMKDMFSLGYDFRDIGDIRKMSIYFDSITKLVEGLYKSFNKTFIFVSHSMGSPLISHFLQNKSDEWKNKYIDSWYSINGAFGGSAKALATTLIGDTFSIPSYFASPLKYRSALVTHPSIYFLFPSPKIFDHNKTLIIYKKSGYNVTAVREFIPSVMKPEMSRVLKYVPDIFVENSPNVHMACVYGKGISTPTIIEFDTDSFDGTYIQHFGDGDGTVNLESLTACSKWEKGNSKELEIVEFPNSSHIGLLQNRFFLLHFENFIRKRLVDEVNKKVLS